MLLKASDNARSAFKRRRVVLTQARGIPTEIVFVEGVRGEQHQQSWDRRSLLPNADGDRTPSVFDCDRIRNHDRDREPCAH
jgi:hypothetical protein